MWCAGDARKVQLLLSKNAKADYAGAAIRGHHMKLGFLRHSLMISRMHFMLEMSARNPIPTFHGQIGGKERRCAPTR